MADEARQQVRRAHHVLRALGVPETGADGAPLSLEARLVRYARKHEMLVLPIDIPAEQWCDARAFTTLAGRVEVGRA